MSKPGSGHPPAGSKARVPEDAPLTENEKKIIALAHEQLGDKLKNISEQTILRFVRGFKDDPKPQEKTLEMLTSMVKWRQENKVDELAQTKLPGHEKFHAMWPAGVHGVGKTGHPVYIEKVGAVDPYKLETEFKMDDVIKFHIQTMENLTNTKDKISRETGKTIYKQIVVLDLKGLGMAHISEKFRGPMKQLVHIDQFNYPETLYVMILVNASFIVKTLWAIASPWLDPITKERIKWGAEHLTHYIDKDQLPQYLGGTCKCKDGKCLINEFVPGDNPQRAAALAAMSAEKKERELSLSKSTGCEPKFEDDPEEKSPKHGDHLTVKK